MKIDPKTARLWRLKLKHSGFNDIEDSVGNLKEHHAHKFRSKRKSHTEIVVKERYYQLASQLAHSHKFDSDLDHAVWALHANGKYESEIADMLGITKSKAHRIIANVRKLLSSKL